MIPVEIVHLNLHEVPVYGVVHRHGGIEHLLLSVEGEAEVAYASCLAFCHQVVEHSVVDEALVEVVHAVAYRVQEQIVDIVGLQFAHRVVIHLDGCFTAMCVGREV